MKILDAVKGTAAGPMALTVSKKTADGGWTQIANGYQLEFISATWFKPYTCCRDSALLCNRMTDATGEIHNLITEEAFPPGVYRVDFDTKSYWKNEGSTPFHEVTDVSVIRCLGVHPI